MSNPLTGDVHVNRALSNVSVAHIQDIGGFVADRVFPNIPSSSQSDLYFLYDRGDMNRDEMKLRAPGTESAGGQFKVTQDSFHIPVYSFHDDVSDPQRANQDAPLELDTDATVYVTNKAILKRETLFVNQFFLPSKWGSDVEGVASGPTGTQVLRWDDDASDPIKNIRTQMTNMHEATGFRPNVLTLQQRALDALVDHPDIVDRVKFGQTPGGPATVGVSELAALFKIERIEVMGAVVNTAEEGATEASAFVGGKHALLTYSAPRAGKRIATAGYTFSWNGLLGSSAQGGRVKKFRMEEIESDRIEKSMAVTQKIVSADLGIFFETIVS